MHDILGVYIAGRVPQPEELREMQIGNLREIARAGVPIGATVVIMRAEHGEGIFGKGHMRTYYRGFGIRMVKLRSLLIKPTHLFIEEDNMFPAGGFYRVGINGGALEYGIDSHCLGDLKTDVLYSTNTSPISPNATIFMCQPHGWEGSEPKQIFESFQTGIALLKDVYTHKDNGNHPISFDGEDVNQFLANCASKIHRECTDQGLIYPKIAK